MSDSKQLHVKSTGYSDSQLMLPNLACTLRMTEMATAPKVLSLTKRTPATSEQKGREYAPLASVWYGEDAELLERLLCFYPRKNPRKILDATINGGRFWRDSKRPVVGIDIDQRHRPTFVADNTRMPFADASFDVVVYDPPHIPNQGKD